MTLPQLELEGTWEEILSRSREFTGRRVRLIVFPEPPPEQFPGIEPESRPSTAGSLLQYAGTWAGDDGEALHREVHAMRSRARF